MYECTVVYEGGRKGFTIRGPEKDAVLALAAQGIKDASITDFIATVGIEGSGECDECTSALK